MRTGSKAEGEASAEDPLFEHGDARTLSADVDSVPSFSSIVETQSASGQHKGGRAVFDGGPEIGDVVAGHYRVLSVLGEGGMGPSMRVRTSVRASVSR